MHRRRPQTICFTPRAIGILVATLLLGPRAIPAAVFELAVVSYNVESDADTDPDTVARDIARIPESHLWGLSEVDPRHFDKYRIAVGDRYKILKGTTGGADRLALVYDPEILTVKENAELSEAGGSRHPLMARFEMNGPGREIIVVLNHLQRGNARTRRAQAQWLNQWAAKANDEPPSVILLGDYNFDVEPNTKRGNRAYELFLEGGVFRWIEPSCIAQAACPATGTGCNPRYSSILDFVFLAGDARTWAATSEILFKNDATYCRNEKRGGSDHRPVCALVSVP